MMGPIIEPAGGKLESGLTTLGKGERWLLEPQQLDDSGRLWSPGIRENVKPGSAFHQTEYFGPVLGLIAVSSLTEALSVQNGVEYGLTAGIHSLDPAEVSFWLSRVEAGNCYVNRGITGAIVQRQSFGGWKKSSVGPGAKAGGPNYLFGLGQWLPRTSQRKVSVGELDSFSEEVLGSIPGITDDERAFLARSVASDKDAWNNTYGVSSDRSNLVLERNVFRYHPAAVTIRASGLVSVPDTLRVLLAGLRTGATIHLSSADRLPGEVLKLLRETPEGFSSLQGFVVESEAEFLARIRTKLPQRIRLLGSRVDAMSVALNGALEVAIYGDDVTESGRVEMLPFVLEQAVSMTAHRFGALDPRFSELTI
jgi:RHH-type proline utilization regulon transcriptional repressor/proline dehydrogenase/delta 1-pyrroline-5-carboxylate dehydrogenase